MNPVPERPEFEGFQESRRPPLWVIAWRRKALIVLGLVIGTVGGALYYSRLTPIYQSQAQIVVIRKGNPVMPIGGDPRQMYYEDYLSTHQHIIKSHVVVTMAVKDHKLSQLKMFQGMGDPTGAVLGGLTVTRDQTGPTGTVNNILYVSYKGTVPDECAVVVDKIIHSYREYLEKTYTTISNDNLTEVTRLAEDLKKTLAQKQQAHKDFLQKNKDRYKGPEGMAARKEWVAQLRTELGSLEIRKFQLETHLHFIKKAIQEGQDRSKLLAIIRLGPSRLGSKEKSPLDDQLMTVRMQIEDAKRRLGVDHPDLRTLLDREQIILTAMKQAPLIGPKSGKVGDLVPSDDVQIELLTMETQLDQIVAQQRLMQSMFDKEQKVVGDFSELEEEDRSLRDDIEWTRKQFQPILEKLEYFKLVQDRGGYDAKILSPPGAGGRTGPASVQVFTLGGMVGVLFGLGLAYLAELTDKSFRTPDEIRRRLGLPVIGHIPVLRSTVETANGSVLDPALVTFHQPKSIQAEAYRGVRTSLFFSMQGESGQVIQFTSPNARDGKSTLTANLGVCIAQSGKKVLLIDGDLRKPRLHKIFGIAPANGLASVIAQGGDVHGAILATEVPGLSLLPCGRRPDNPSELLNSPRFLEIVEKLRGEYDFVLIDTPPLLAVSDPSVLASRVDGVVLVLRVAKNGQPNAERAKEILSTLGARVLGVVVNGVGRGPGGGGYDYNRYYSYYYDYDYSYSDDKEHETYYHEDESDGSAPASSGRKPGAGAGSKPGAPGEPAGAPSVPPPVPPVQSAWKGEGGQRPRIHDSRRLGEKKGWVETLFPWWH